MSKDYDTYRTILNPSEGIILKEKGSKFLGFAFPIVDEKEVQTYLNLLKKQHPSANHCCYAYQLGIEKFHYRVFDDGEPHHSAGQPIYGQLLSFNLTNVLVVVIRYFGGTKLGKAGLVSSYKTAAQYALGAAEIVEKKQEITLKLEVEYANLYKIMRFVKEHQLKVKHQKMNGTVEIKVIIEKSKTEKYVRLVASLPYVKNFDII